MINELNIDDFQIRNEKQPLSIDGEELAKRKLSIDELNNLDCVYSSHFVRTMATAKYLLRDDQKLVIDSNLGERRNGIEEDKRTSRFSYKQILNENLKYPLGESRFEVKERLLKSLSNILNNEYERCAVVFHANAMFFLLMELCDFEIIDEVPTIKFNGKTILDKKIDFCQIFKLKFDQNNNLVDIENLG